MDGGRLNLRLIGRNESLASNRSQISVFSASDNLRITHLHNETPHSRRRCCNDPLTSQPLWAVRVAWGESYPARCASKRVGPISPLGIGGFTPVE